MNKKKFSGVDGVIKIIKQSKGRKMFKIVWGDFFIQCSE